jgi:hypothetical protein
LALSVWRFASHPVAALLSQLPKPAVHERPQVPLHVAVELGPLAQGVHDAPHEAMLVSLAHVAPHA